MKRYRQYLPAAAAVGGILLVTAAVLTLDPDNPTRMELFVGRLHPLVVHLPIGFLVLAVLLEALSRFEGFRQVRHALPAVLVLSAASAVAAAIAGYQPQRARPRNLDGLAKNVRLGDDGRYHWHWDPAYRTGHRHLEGRQARLEQCARELSLPTLLVRGGLSDILTEEGARSFLELCPHSEYVNVTGAAHMVAGDRNDVFADAILAFLDRRIGREGAAA